MATLSEMYKRVDAFDADRLTTTVISEQVDTLADIQRDQMKHGLNSEGEPIGYYAMAAYAEMKNRMNPLPGNGVVDLLLTGDFYRGIEAEIGEDEIIFGSSDDKSDMLQDKYGEEIFGMNPDSRAKYREIFYKKYIFELKRLLKVD